ncbi:sigma 54-interacting transcriptional regulator [Desulfitibacter alkalitolerans]|uniref:sigma 54-interacting transcriptional regulator n=1 Tax=Desulfitibacter alkalitolerans TaxID=264641 RepID=UPI000685A223|nr:sigma 54-interacting transcriptional regulator [Desulfitibacter alkalitolerans]
MNITKIAMIVPRKDMATLARDVCQELGAKVHISIGEGSAAINMAKKLASNGIEIIISNSKTTSAIKSVVNLPVTELTFTSWDILSALNEAKKISDKIAIIKCEALNCSMHYAQRLLGISLYEINLTHEVEKCFLGLKDLGLKVAVVQEEHRLACEKHGIIPITISYGRESIRQAITLASDVLTAKQNEVIRFEWINKALDSMFEGLLAVDQRGIICFINKKAEILLGLSKSEILDKHYTKVLPEFAFEDALRFKQKRISDYHTHKGMGIVANITPIVIGSESIGAVCTLNGVEIIERMKQKSAVDTNHGLYANYTFNNLVTKSDCLIKVIETAKKYAGVDSNVLIIGETGTGKEIFAQSIHNHSERKNYSFVSVNCAALPENLLESELFGYEEGAFTGAKKGGKIGLFELADKGTIFLDEIGEVSLEIQARLLRVLQQREIMKVGGSKLIKVDVRVLAATNKNILQLVEKGLFRRDLYHRLNVLNINIPPLRERPKDIPVLANYLVKKNSKRLNRPMPAFSKEAIEILEKYKWPGNVRELENIIERMVVLKDGLEVAPDDLINLLDTRNKNGELANQISINLNQTLAQIENGVIREALKISKTKEEAANILGISTTTLWRKTKNLSS